MREIKFRAKTISGDWVYGDYLSQYKNGVTEHYIASHPNGRDGGSEVMWRILVDTLGQFTGPEDRNGTNIYEDDVMGIKAMGSISNARVVFENGAFVVSNPLQSSRPNVGDLLGLTNYEVIGNIHDNPGLLG